MSSRLSCLAIPQAGLLLSMLLPLPLLAARPACRRPRPMSLPSHKIIRASADPLCPKDHSTELHPTRLVGQRDVPMYLSLTFRRGSAAHRTIAEFASPCIPHVLPRHRSLREELR